MKYRVLVEQDEDGVFVAEAPSLPGCVSQGATRAHALQNIQEAIHAYLESLEAHDAHSPIDLRGGRGGSGVSVLPRVSGREAVPALAKGLLRAILRQAGLTVEELKDLL